MITPCKDCICIPICRHKRIKHLFDDCSLVKEYEPDWSHKTSRNPYKLYKIQEMINPTKWIYNYERNFLDGWRWMDKASEIGQMGHGNNNENM
jgi:hypothetical protein